MARAKKNLGDIQKRLGNRVRKIRQERGWTQLRLAEAAGMSKTYVCDLENGRKEPCLGSIQILAHTFEMSLAEFFGPL
jgi:transcriptional regulator with XRE-family HTH domain